VGGEGKKVETDETEASFKWNNRIKLGIDDATRANNAIKSAAGKRPMYRQPDEKGSAG
jgi:hypothetical protein